MPPSKSPALQVVLRNAGNSFEQKIAAACKCEKARQQSMGLVVSDYALALRSYHCVCRTGRLAVFALAFQLAAQTSLLLHVCGGSTVDF